MLNESRVQRNAGMMSATQNFTILREGDAGVDSARPPSSVERRVRMLQVYLRMLQVYYGNVGLEHEKLTYRYSGRDFRSTDVEARRRKGH